jgi:two-component system phosphate regulon sensor histidine kinase PhoR
MIGAAGLVTLCFVLLASILIPAQLPPDQAVQAQRIVLITAFLLLASQAALLLCVLGLLQSFHRPLRLLSRAARRLGEGAFGQRVRVRAGGEIGELVRAFNQMVADVDERIGQLRETETTMRTAFAHMADGVVVLDLFGRILLFNTVATETFGRSASQAQGRTLLEIALHPELDTLVSQALRTRRQGSAEIQLRRPTHRILRVYVTPVIDEAESPLGAVLVFQDLTEIRRLENVRRDFVTNASHELKTPLATLGVMADSLKRGMDDPQAARRFLDMLGTEVQRLGALVDDLLELSRIESGQILYEWEVVALDGVLRALVERFRPAAEQRHQSLRLTVEGKAPVWGDPNALYRMASNLVENALKYTPEGGRIEVSSGRSGEELYVQVADTGIGIPEDEQARIFERFYRVDKARSRATGGTGLGLSIVKHTVETHGGRIELESAPGRGSAFTVWLPALAEEELAGETPSEV